MNIVTDSTRLIVMVSESAKPTPPPGGTLYALTDDQRTAYLSAAQKPNNGVAFDGATFSSAPFVAPTPFDFSNIDNLDKTFKALGLMIANFTGKTPAQVKQAYLNAWNALP